MVVKAEEPAQSWSDIALSQAILWIGTEKRPTICFLCLGNPNLTIRERSLSVFKPGCLSKHFRTSMLRSWEGVSKLICRICGVNLVHRMHLQHHAEKFHGTVSRVRI